MTAILHLRLVKDLRGAHTEDGVIADVFGLDTGGGRLPANDHRDVVIPAGYLSTPLPLKVAPGTYLVEATLPSGDIASQQVEVADGAEADVELTASHSPHEWLSWQQFLGNVPARPEQRARARAMTKPPQPPVEADAPLLARIDQARDEMRYELSMTARASRHRRDRGDRSGGGGRGGGNRDLAYGGGGAGLVARGAGLAFDLGGGWGGAGDDVAAPPAARRRPAPAPTVDLIAAPVAALGTGDVWSLLVSQRTRRSPVQALSLDQEERLSPAVKDRDRSLLIIGEDAGEPGATGHRFDDYVPRRYLVARTRGLAELACLPVPWRTDGPTVPIEVLVRRDALPGEATLAMSPRDPRIGPALGYMANGSLTKANVLFDRAQDLLYDKMINPLAAAAGGYMLLAVEEGGKDQAWHTWVRRLAERFPWMPDGMVQLGRLALRHREGADYVQQARDAFFEAFDRGLPFYSLGLQWLVDGLSLLARTEVDGAASRLAQVQEVCWRANLQQPFTTIRLVGR